MSLRQLEYFAAVAERLSFRVAADDCCVTQPGLSAQLKDLERFLGVQLLERSQRRVLLTPAGQTLLPLARSILTASDQFVELASSMTKPLSGTLRLGVISTVAPYLLPKVLPAIRREYPQLQILLHEEFTHRILELLSQGKLDLLLLALEADLGDVATLPLARDPFVLAVPAQHRLAKRKRVTKADLAGEQVLLLRDGHCLRNHALAICEKCGADEIGDFRASSLSTLVQMVASGIGITLLPRMSLEVESRDPSPIAVRPFKEPGPSRTIGLAWRTTSPREHEFRLLAKLLMV